MFTGKAHLHRMILGHIWDQFGSAESELLSSCYARNTSWLSKVTYLGTAQVQKWQYFFFAVNFRQLLEAKKVRHLVE